MLASLLALSSLTNEANAARQDTVACASIYYMQGRSDYNPDLRENSDAVGKLVKTVGSRRITNICVVSSASPEGNSDFNQTISEQRNQTAINLLQNLNGFYSATKNIKSIGTDWKGLAEMVERSEMQYAAEAASLIRNTPEWIKDDSVVIDSRKLRLRLLRDNRPWQYMEQFIFPEMRVSHICIAVTDQATVEAPITTANTDELKPVMAPVKPEPIISENLNTSDQCERPTTIAAVKTNLLYDIAATPNLGVELMLRKGWSVGISGMYAWWSKNDMSKVWRIQNAEISLKKYLGSTPPHCINRYHIGCYAHICRYDILLGKTGYLSGGPNDRFLNRPWWGGGIEAGYTLLISKNLCLDFSLGVGYLTGRYLTYKSSAGHNIWESTRIRHWFGPTKAEISLVWLIRKGGAK